jgi:type 1 glutamine amidotransferase
MRRIPGRLAGLVLLLACGLVGAEEKLKALIIDGQNNHNWQATTPLLKQALQESGRFSVEVATTAPKDKGISDFKPDFARFSVVVSNYNGELWPEETRKSFVDYIEGGGGLVVVHAANNAFPSWREYNEMIGLGWRGPEFGERVTVSEDGKVERTAKGQGPGAGHGPQHEFPVITRDEKHPITAGLPKVWLHYKDELYHGQRGPAPRDMHILATAFSASDKGGTGAHEPMLWVIPYGKGRVFTTVLGHSPEAMTCVGFITTLQRGAEWAATGKVTLTKLPDDFPTADKIVRRKGDN